MLRNSRTLLNRLGQCTAFAAGGGSTLLLSSVFIQSKPQQQTMASAAAEAAASWRIVDYPSAGKSSKEGAPVQLARKIDSKIDQTGLGLRLYQYQSCPYCCKVRAFLDYFGFSYEVVEVNPVTRSQIKFAKNYKKVPIMTTTAHAEPLVESSLIVSTLATFLVRPELSFADVLPMYPDFIKKDEKTGKEVVEYPNQHFVMWGDSPLSGDQMRDVREEREWRLWVDKHFIHTISPNVYRTFGESLETFRWFDRVGDWQRNFPVVERQAAIWVGASMMWAISNLVLKKRHKITDEREAMRAAFDQFLDAKGPHRKFMGGDQPNLADLSLFGACNSFSGCRAFVEMRERDARIGQWFDAVEQAVREGRGKALLEAKSRAVQQKEQMGTH